MAIENNQNLEQNGTNDEKRIRKLAEGLAYTVGAILVGALLMPVLPTGIGVVVGVVACGFLGQRIYSNLADEQKNAIRKFFGFDKNKTESFKKTQLTMGNQKKRKKDSALVVEPEISDKIKNEPSIPILKQTINGSKSNFQKIDLTDKNCRDNINETINELNDKKIEIVVYIIKGDKKLKEFKSLLKKPRGEWEKFLNSAKNAMKFEGQSAKEFLSRTSYLNNKLDDLKSNKYAGEPEIDARIEKVEKKIQKMLKDPENELREFKFKTYHKLEKLNKLDNINPDLLKIEEARFNNKLRGESHKNITRSNVKALS